jgi:hypothetical protein
VDKYKGEAGNSDRISFVWWPEDEEGTPDLSQLPRFVGGKRHYIKGVGYFWDKGPEFTKIAGKEAKKMAATIIAVWPTDKDGQIDKESPGLHRVRVMPWIFSADKYKILKRKHNEWPVGAHDMVLSCTDSQFQKMDISACRESLFAKLIASDKDGAKGIVKKMNADIAAIAASLGGMIANDYTIDQVREKLGGGGGGGDLGGAVANDAQVDAMLDDIIDV